MPLLWRLCASSQFYQVLSVCVSSIDCRIFECTDVAQLLLNVACSQFAMVYKWCLFLDPIYSSLYMYTVFLAHRWTPWWRPVVCDRVFVGLYLCLCNCFQRESVCECVRARVRVCECARPRLCVFVWKLKRVYFVRMFMYKHSLE